MKTNVIEYLKNYIKKNKPFEEEIKNGSYLESPAMIGYYEAKDIIDLADRIDKAIEHIEKAKLGKLKNGKPYYLINDSVGKNLLDILKGEDNE